MARWLKDIGLGFKNRWKQIIELGIIGSFMGVLYQFINQHFVDFSSVIIGFPLGFGFGVLELVYLERFNPRLRKIPFLWVVLFKSFLYTFLIFGITIKVGFTAGWIMGKDISEFWKAFFSMEHIGLIVYTLVFYAIMLIYIQVTNLLGKGVFSKFILGKYRQPIEEERIFMFLDLKSSTTIAEKLGNEKYYAFLNDFFHTFTDPVMKTDAEIYQYVGDEVVFNWPLEKGLEGSNCINIFYEIKQKINRRKNIFLEKYGYFPEFKAGIHFGKVISAQIGDIKKEIVYNGDILNTTSRIQNLCNNTGCEILISGQLYKLIDAETKQLFERIGRFNLEGKEEDIELHGIKKLEINSMKQSG